jgi:uncharacterized membrane protein YedE/YeeE
VTLAGFTPVSAVIGGALIGLAAVLLLRGAGRIAGISGILNGVATRDAADRGWRVVFLLGLICGAGLGFFTLGDASAARAETSAGRLIVAGLLVGAGTRLGNGCTSGHGICGLSRLSLRWLVAVIVFIGAGIATVSMMRHVLAGSGS